MLRLQQQRVTQTLEIASSSDSNFLTMFAYESTGLEKEKGSSARAGKSKKRGGEEGGGYEKLTLFTCYILGSSQRLRCNSQRRVQLQQFHVHHL